MDRFFDSENARKWLDEYILKQVQGPFGDQFLSNLQASACQVSYHTQPRCYRMTTQVGTALSEVEVRIPGIICSKTLPPQLRPLVHAGESNVRKLRQFVKLTGLQGPLFDGMRVNVEEVVALFRTAIAPNRLQAFEFKPWDADFAIDVHTRYFTDRRHAPSLKHEALPSNVDPHHYLDIVRGGNFIFCHENRVEYCRKEENGMEIKYIPVTPAEFSVGDVVEAGVAFVAYPTGANDFVLKIVLRSLSMVNPSFRQEGHLARQALLAEAPLAESSNRGKRQRCTREEPTTPVLLKRSHFVVDRSTVIKNH
ncbi:hypothetical protein MD484_g6813, partial [Candolleomyces efflorescens]